MNEIPIQCYSSKRRSRHDGPSFDGKPKRGGFLTQNGIKLMADGFMLLDHFAVVIIEQGILDSAHPMRMEQIISTDWGRTWWYIDRVLRCIGRLAFPLFVFFLVEGFYYTHHRRNYGMRLLIFALLSEIPFDLAVFGTWWYPEYQNVMFTLLIAYLTLCAVWYFGTSVVMQAVCVAAGCLLAQLLRVDYGAMGVMMAVLLYWFRGSRHQLGAGAVYAALESLSSWGTAALAFGLLWFYRGEKGRWPGKYFFYLFYPGHLLVLYLVYRVWF